jgi:hypothetical protein
MRTNTSPQQKKVKPRSSKKGKKPANKGKDKKRTRRADTTPSEAESDASAEERQKKKKRVTKKATKKKAKKFEEPARSWANVGVEEDAEDASSIAPDLAVEHAKLFVKTHEVVNQFEWADGEVFSTFVHNSTQFCTIFRRCGSLFQGRSSCYATRRA